MRKAKAYRCAVIRPLNSEERFMQLKSCWSCSDDGTLHLEGSETEYAQDRVINCLEDAASGPDMKHKTDIKSLAADIADIAMASSVCAVMAVGSLGGGSSHTMWGNKSHGLATEIANRLMSRPNVTLSASFVHHSATGLRDITIPFTADIPRVEPSVSYQDCGLVIGGVARFPIATSGDLVALIGLRHPAWLRFSDTVSVLSGDESTSLVLHITMESPSTYVNHTLLLVDAGAMDCFVDKTPHESSLQSLDGLIATLDTEASPRTPTVLPASDGFLQTVLKPVLFGPGRLVTISCIGPTIRDQSVASGALETVSRWHRVVAGGGLAAGFRKSDTSDDLPRDLLTILLRKRVTALTEDIIRARASMTTLTDRGLHRKAAALAKLRHMRDATRRALDISLSEGGGGSVLHSLVAESRTALARAHLHRSSARPSLRVLHPNPSVSGVFYIHVPALKGTVQAKKVVVGAPTDPAPQTTLLAPEVGPAHLVLLLGRTEDGASFLAVSPGGAGTVMVNGLRTKVPQATEDNDRVVIGGVALEVLLSSDAKPRVAYNVCSLEAHVGDMLTFSDPCGVTFRPLQATVNALNRWIGDTSSAAKTYDHLRTIQAVNPVKFGVATLIIARALRAAVLARALRARAPPDVRVIPILSRQLSLARGSVEPVFSFLIAHPSGVSSIVPLVAAPYPASGRSDLTPTPHRPGLIGVARVNLCRLTDIIEFNVTVRPPHGVAPSETLGRLRVTYRPTSPEGVIRRMVRDDDANVDGDDAASDDGLDEDAAPSDIAFEIVVEKVVWPSTGWADVAVKFSMFDGETRSTSTVAGPAAAHEFRERFPFTLDTLDTTLQTAIQRHVFVFEVWGRSVQASTAFIEELVEARDEARKNLEAIAAIATMSLPTDERAL